MIDPLTTFLGSAGGGMLTGLIKTGIHIWVSNKKAKREHEIHRDAILIKADTDLFDRRIQAAEIKPLKYTNRKRWTERKWLICGPAVRHEKLIERDKLSQLPREKSVAFIVTLFAFVYAACVVWYLYNMATTFEALAPTPGGRFSLLGLLEFEWGKNKTLEFSGGGAGLYLLSPIILWITHHITGRTTGKS
jgi:hypothetical protein